MNPTLVLVDTTDPRALPRLVTVAEAAHIMQLDEADVANAVAEWGRCDDGKHIAIDGCIALGVTEAERRAAHG